MPLSRPSAPGLWTRLKENWSRIKNGRRGSRFLDCFHYKQELRAEHGTIHRRVDLLLGYGLVFVGLILIPAPGPGWVTVALGAALLAGESERVAGFMDRLEVFGHQALTYVKSLWRRASLVMKSAVALVAGSLAAGAGYAAYIFFQAFIR